MEENAMKEQTNIILCLLNKITDDGRITEEKVNDLRQHILNENGTYNINLEIANRLFELFNMAKNEQVVDKSFYRLFTDAICAHLLKDQSSTGVLDDREVDWLVGKIENNLGTDDKLFDLIKELKAKSFNNFPKKLDSAITLRRLRGIQRKFSESNNAGEELFKEIVEQLKECVKERDKLFIDDKCILALFGIKDLLSRKKFLQLPDDRNEQAEKKNTGESHTDQFINVFCELVSANVLYDENSPYDVDGPEANKLKDIINHKTSVDYIDKVLLDELESRSMYFPEVLAKVRFGYETASVRATVVNTLLEKKDEEKAKAAEYAKDAKNALDGYINKSFECTNEQKLKAEFLFDLKNLTKREVYEKGEKKEEKDIEYLIQDLFVEQVTKYITGEESQSPNEIDGENEKWLNERLRVSESRYYRCDEELLIQLKNSSVNFPHSLELHLSRAIMMRKLRELKKKNANEICNDLDLRELKGVIFDDNDEFKIEPKEAAEFIFKIKDIIYKKKKQTKEKKKQAKEKKKQIKEINEKFSDFFVKVVSSYLLGDKRSPGKIDETETEWLLAKININGKTDDYDKALLESLERTSINHPNVLHYVGRIKNGFREVLHISRKMCWVAIVSCVIASIFLFFKGAMHVLNAGSNYFVQCDPVMVMDSTQIAKIKNETGLTCDTILVEKVVLKGVKLKNKNGEKDINVKNIRLVTNQNSSTNGEKAILGVQDPNNVAKDCEAKDNNLRQESILLKGITDINGNKSDVNLKLKSIKLVERKVGKRFKSVTNEKTFVEIIDAIDSFLVALVVFILGIGIFELFIRKLEKPYKINEKRPSWMQMNSIDDLKSSLVKVLIIAMIVGFYKKTLSPSFEEKQWWFSAIGIVLIAITFCITEISAHYHHKSNVGDNKNEEKE